MPPSEATTLQRPVLLGLFAGVTLALRIATGVHEEQHPVTIDLVSWAPLEGAEAEAKRNGLAVLYVFGAKWCEPCKELHKRVFAEPMVASNLNRRFVIVQVDADSTQPESVALKQQYEVKALPTLVVVPTDPRFKSGPVRLEGFTSESLVTSFLSRAPTIP